MRHRLEGNAATTYLIKDSHSRTPETRQEENPNGVKDVKRSRDCLLRTNTYDKQAGKCVQCHHHGGTPVKPVSFWAWWCMLVTSALGRQRQKISLNHRKFKARIHETVSNLTNQKAKIWKNLAIQVLWTSGLLIITWAERVQNNRVTILEDKPGPVQLNADQWSLYDPS